MKTRNRVFISYRRDGGAMPSRLLENELQNRGLHTFRDVTSLGSGPFDQALSAEIARCPDFILVLTPGALDRCQQEGDWVRQEISQAIRVGANIVPVLSHDFQWPDAPLPDDIAAIRRQQSVRWMDVYFHASMDRLVPLLRSRTGIRRRNMLLVAGTLTVVVAVGVARFALMHGRLGATPPPAPAPTQAGSVAQTRNAIARLSARHQAYDGMLTKYLPEDAANWKADLAAVEAGRSASGPDAVAALEKRLETLIAEGVAMEMDDLRVAGALDAIQHDPRSGAAGGGQPTPAGPHPSPDEPR